VSGERARILVVDDEKVIRDSCTRILTTEGHIIKSAENGNIGLEVFREFHPDLVLDHRLCYCVFCSGCNEKRCI
jgi:CheY-like chemotaxis protein